MSSSELSWPARRSEHEVLDAVVARAGTLHHRRRRARQLPLAGGALLVTVVIAASVLGGPGTSSSLRTVPADSSETTVSTSVGNAQAGADASAGDGGESGPPSGKLRVTAAGKSVGYGTKPNPEEEGPPEPADGQLMADPSGDADGDHQHVGVMQTSPETDPWLERSEPSADILAATLGLRDDALVATVDVLDLSSDILENETRDGVPPEWVTYSLTFSLDDPNEWVVLEAKHHLEDDAWAYLLHVRHETIVETQAADGRISLGENRVTISAAVSEVNALLQRSTDDGIRSGATLSNLALHTVGGRGADQVVETGSVIDRAYRPGGSSYRL